MQHLFWGLVIGVFGVITPTLSKTAAYFSPGLECENHVIQLIDEAQKSIDIAIYSLTNKNIAAALERAFERKIAVRILTDKQQAGNKYASALDLYQKGISIRVHSKHRIEHNKFMVVDGNKMITGSYNWTESATWKNSENCLLIWEDDETVDKYQKRFEYLWEMNTQEKSDRWFKNKLI